MRLWSFRDVKGLCQRPILVKQEAMILLELLEVQMNQGVGVELNLTT